MSIFGIQPSLLQIESFEHPYMLLCVVLLPVYLFVAFRYPRFALRRLFVPRMPGDSSEKQATRPPHLFIDLKALFPSWRFFAAILALIAVGCCYICLTIAVARPYGHSIYEGRAEGVDVYFVLDMSSSMRAYDGTLRDIRDKYRRDETIYNRYDDAREAILAFIEARSDKCQLAVGARCDRIGIALFGQDAFVDVPLTRDYKLLSEHLKRREIDDIDSSQSAIGDGLMRAIASLRHSSSPSRSIVVLTDGDRKGGRIGIEQVVAAANLYGVHVFPVMAGVNDTAVLAQMQPNGEMGFYEAQFPVNEALLTSLADQTGGAVFRASDREALIHQLGEWMDRMEPSVMSDDSHEGQVELALYFIAISLMFGLGAYFLYMMAIKHYP